MPKTIQLEKTSHLQPLRELLALSRNVNAKGHWLFIPAFLAFVGALLEGASVALLMPLLKGVIEGSSPLTLMPAQMVSYLKQTWPDAHQTQMYVGLVALLYVIVLWKNGFVYGSSLAMSRVTKRFINQLRQHIFDRFLKFGKAYYDKASQGHLQSLLSTYPDRIAMVLEDLQAILTWLFMVAIYVTLLVILSPQLAGWVGLIFGCLYLVSNFLLGSMKRASHESVSSKRALHASLYNVLSCLPLVKAYTNEVNEKSDFSETCDRLSAVEYSMAKSVSLVGPFREIVRITALVALVFVTSLLLPDSEGLNVAGYIVFLYVVKRTVDTLSAIGLAYSQIARKVGFIRPVTEIMDDHQKYIPKLGPNTFTGFGKEIKFEDVCFEYRPNVPVLTHVDFTIPKGKMTAIVGPTGCGKTTLLHLLINFYTPTSGRITIDDEPLDLFNFNSLRHKIALVSQETFLMNHTIKHNITYGSDAPTPRDLLLAIHKAKLSDWIGTLPEGIFTKVGDRGLQLSGDQKQRIAIARALMKNPDILLLDEATSGLDSQTESLVQEAMFEAIKGRTSVVVAHRMSTIRKADHVVVLKSGQIAQMGTVSELLKLQGLFHDQ